MKGERLCRCRFAQIGFVCPVICERDAASRHGARTQNSSRETSLQRISRGLNTRASQARTIFFREVLIHQVRPKRKSRSPMVICFFFLVEHRGFEPLTPTLPVLCAPNCANAPPVYHIIFVLACQAFFLHFCVFLIFFAPGAKGDLP